MGFNNFKIVERNTPTPVLLARVKAYAERRYDGNLLDLVQNYSYPEEAFGGKARDAYSLRRLVKYFVKPSQVNVVKLAKVIEFGRVASVLYPRRGPNPVMVDNRALDGFMDRFHERGCADLDCEECRYCHGFADKAVRIDPEWRARMEPIYDDLIAETDGGGFWAPYSATVAETPGAIAKMMSELAG
ncbi:MAG: hypothetical protein FJ087_17535 [Deltaproteobacteria bacterium]|nr:hypothetical protein [Deltaproteobacteria bacterium]